MPGAGARLARKQRRSQQRQCQPEQSSPSGLYAALLGLPPGLPLPDCPSFAVPDRSTTTGVRIDVGSHLGFGEHGSDFRRTALDNLVALFVGSLYPWLTGIQWFPGGEDRTGPTAILALHFFDDRDGITAREAVLFKQFFVSVLPDATVRPSFTGVALFEALPRRKMPYLSYTPPELPPAPASSQEPPPVCILQPCPMFGLPAPTSVTVKIRGLRMELHRPGCTALFLEAAGYPAHTFSVHLEYYPPLKVHGRTPLQPLHGVQDFSVVMATVYPPPGDPGMVRAARRWLLPGHSHAVKVTVIPSAARPVAGVPVPPPPKPIVVGSQRGQHRHLALTIPSDPLTQSIMCDRPGDQVTQLPVPRGSSTPVVGPPPAAPQPAAADVAAGPPLLPGARAKLGRTSTTMDAPATSSQREREADEPRGLSDAALSGISDSIRRMVLELHGDVEDAGGFHASSGSDGGEADYDGYDLDDL